MKAVRSQPSKNFALYNAPNRISDQGDEMCVALAGSFAAYLSAHHRSINHAPIPSVIKSLPLQAAAIPHQSITFLSGPVLYTKNLGAHVCEPRDF